MNLDLGYVVVLTVVLGSIFVVYFLARRALVGFRRGYDDARRDR